MNAMSSVISIEAETTVPTRHGDFRFVVFRSGADCDDHVALIRGDREKLVERSRDAGVLVSVHVGCMQSEVFGSTACSCAVELDRALETIAREPDGGMVIYLRREDRKVANDLLRVFGVERVRPLQRDL